MLTIRPVLQVLTLKMALTDTQILSYWRNPDFAGSYRGAKTFQIFLKTDLGEDVSINRIYKLLKTDKIFILHQRPIRNIERRRFDVKFYGQVCQSDLAFMFKHNDFNSFLLLIDVFSLKIFVEPLKSKSSQAVKLAFEKIFKDFKSEIHILETDRGSGKKRLVQNTSTIFSYILLNYRLT